MEEKKVSFSNIFQSIITIKLIKLIIIMMVENNFKIISSGIKTMLCVPLNNHFWKCH